MLRTRLCSSLLSLTMVGVLTAGCSVSSDSEGDVSTGATTTTFPVEPARGVTEDSIKIGLALIDVDKVREQFKIELGNAPADLIKGYAEILNEGGGINGRKVELVERRFLPVGTEDPERACRELIEDEQVFAVVGTFLGDTALCVTETHATPYFGGFGLNPERRARSKAPFITTGNDEADAMKESLELLVKEGTLKGAKVALFSNSAMSQEFFDTNVKSILDKGKVNVVSTAQLSDTGGDVVAAGNEMSRIFQRFQADGADTVINLVGLEAFVPALTATEWKPKLIFTTGQILSPQVAKSFGNVAPTELEGAVGVVPGVFADEVAEDPILLDCLKKINATTDLAIQPKDLLTKDQDPASRDFRNVPLLCDFFNLLKVVLEAAGDNPSSESIVAGLDDLESFKLIGNPKATLSRERWGAGVPVRIMKYDATKDSFGPADA